MTESQSRRSAADAIARARHNIELVAGELALAPEWADPKRLALAMTACSAEVQTAEAYVDTWLEENAAGAK